MLALRWTRNRRVLGQIPSILTRFWTEGSEVQILSPRPITSAGRPEKSGFFAVRMVALSRDAHSVPPERRFDSNRLARQIVVEMFSSGNSKSEAAGQIVMLTLCPARQTGSDRRQPGIATYTLLRCEWSRAPWGLSGICSGVLNGFGAWWTAGGLVQHSTATKE